jgi:phage tail sheath protein FI
MATTYKTPGVYVEEIPKFPPSVAQVETAIPAFIGYTKIASRDGTDLTNKPTRISSLLEYVKYFGDGYPDQSVTVNLDSTNSVVSISNTPSYHLYNSMQLFFNNGGGDCYIISVGAYKTAPPYAAKTDFISAGAEKCFEVLYKFDEPTLIVIPDAVLLSASDFKDIQQAALKVCGEMMDRFAILDIYNGNTARTYNNNDVIDIFRNNIGTNNLKYGAVYYPWIKTSLAVDVTYAKIILNKGGATTFKNVISDNPLVSQLDNSIADLKFRINVALNTPNFATAPFNAAPYLSISMKDGHNLIPLTNNKNELILRARWIWCMLDKMILLNTTLVDQDTSNTIEGMTTRELHTDWIKTGTATALSNFDEIMRELELLDISYPTGAAPKALGIFPAALPAGYPAFQLAGVVADTTIYGTLNVGTEEADAVKNIRSRFNALFDRVNNSILTFKAAVELRITNLDLQLQNSSAVYGNIIKYIKAEGVLCPPSGAIAGIYAAVDNSRGVWKAPANISLSSVNAPAVNITSKEQSALNVDVNAGLSINVIRSFTGKGTLVWGARTLAGNDNEWRYINVRRFFNMVEESCKKASEAFVFETNDANTWVKVQAMLENFLTTLWRQGALQGVKPEHAFYVAVGLGKTMTALDILEGRMIIEIGMAAVRPAEFIILKFSHKMVES